jgi:hypothetical protein
MCTWLNFAGSFSGEKDTLAYGCGHVVKPFYSIIEDDFQFPVRECFYTYGAIHISMD